MSDLLENELVLKYFACDTGVPHGHCDSEDRRYGCKAEMALQVLSAMQAPIAKGERYLGVWRGAGSVTEDKVKDCAIEGFHPFSLRLPDQWQPKEECVPWIVECEQCGAESTVHTPKLGDTVKVNMNPAPERWKCVMHPNDRTCNRCKSDPVEEKIKSLKWQSSITERELRELVELARKQ